MDPILLQANIGGLAAGTSTSAEVLIGALDAPTGVLLVNLAFTVQRGEAEQRRPGCAVVTNNPATDDRDLLFRETDFRDAINDYYGFAGRGLLVLSDAVRRHDPSTKIEPDGIDERGRRYRFASDIGNGQLAVVVMCWAALRQQGFARQIAAFDDFTDLEVFSVGLPREPGSRAPADIVLPDGTLSIGPTGWPIEPHDGARR